MPFKRAFEKKVNEEMQSDTPSSSHPEASNDIDIKQPTKASQLDQEEEEDIELSEKKDHPPRFSTLFEPVRHPPSTDCYPPAPKRRSGVHLPLPLFIVLALILFFESTLLFAYTVIGLYNNLPHQLLTLGGSRSTITSDVCGCDTTTNQPAINIAPNFYMQPGPAASDEQVTLPVSKSLATSTSPSLVASTSTASPSTTVNTVQAASDILSLFGSLHKTSTTSSAVSVVSVIVTASPSPTAAVTSVEVVAGPTVSSETTINTTIAGRSDSSTSAVVENSPAVSTTTSSPTTLATSPSSTTTEPSATSATETKSTQGSGRICFGSGGAVGQVCE